VPTSGPDVYSDFVKALVDAEATRKTSIESKATGVITTSSALVTILFGLVAVITSRTTFRLPVSAHGWLVGAIAAFVVGAALAILVSFPLPYGQTTITVANLQAWWGDSANQAEAAVAGVRLRSLRAARSNNALKAAILSLASGAELIGLVLLAITVLKILSA
jgi:hypothetical protein